MVETHRIIAEPGDPFHDRVRRLMRHETVLVADVHAEKADALAGLAFKSELPVPVHHPPVFARRSVEPAGEVQRRSLADGAAGFQLRPALSGPDDAGRRLGLQHTPVGERYSGDHPDGMGSGREGDPARFAAGQPETGRIQSHPFAVAVGAECGRSVLQRGGTPPVAAVPPRKHRNPLDRPVGVLHRNLADRFGKFRRPRRCVQQIEPLSRRLSPQLHRRGGRIAAEFRVGQHNAAASRVLRRIDHVIPDARQRLHPGRHGGEIVPRSLVGPSAFAVVGLSVPESHIGRRPEIDRFGYRLAHLEIQRQFRTGDRPLGDGRIEADGIGILLVFAVILNTDAELPAHRDLAVAILKTEGARADRAVFKHHQRLEFRRKRYTPAVRLHFAASGRGGQRQRQRQHRGLHRFRRRERAAETEFALPLRLQGEPTVEHSAGDPPFSGDLRCGSGPGDEIFHIHPESAAPAFAHKDPFKFS